MTFSRRLKPGDSWMLTHRAGRRNARAGLTGALQLGDAPPIDVLDIYLIEVADIAEDIDKDVYVFNGLTEQTYEAIRANLSGDGFSMWSDFQSITSA